jgi:hypothetical protein
MNRLDPSGVLHDMAFDRAHPQLARTSERTFTVTTDCALRAAKEQRAAADHACEHSPIARAVPGYNRLP